MFRQCPMYKFKESNLDGYVMFTANKHHFSVHTLDFNLIEGMKALLPRAQYGKGCVKVKYSDRDAIPFLQTLCDNSIDKYNKANRL